MMRSTALPVRSLRSLSASTTFSPLPSSSVSQLVHSRRSLSLLPTAADRPIRPTPTPIPIAPDTPDKDITFRFDPSAYVYLRPKAAIGREEQVQEYIPGWFVKAFGPILQSFVKMNKQARAIEATRNMLGQASDGLVRNEEFFWEDCQLPRTVQAWYSVHILLVLMYTPRLRALPAKPARLYQEEILTHFFSLLEVRMRRTLGPHIPERFIKKYMIEYGTQFSGQRFGFDQAVLGSDTDLALYLWRNILGARGQPEGTVGVKIKTGLNDRKRVEHLSKIGKADGMGGKIQPKDLDGKMEGEGRIGPVPTTLESPPMLGEIPETWDPLLMGEELNELVGFVRREMKRLESIPDEVLMRGGAGAFGPVREADAVIWDQIIREKAVKVIKDQGSDALPMRSDLA